jgi:hypothetical protein
MWTWMPVTHVKIRRQVLVGTLTIWVPKKAGDFITNLATTSFSGMLVSHYHTACCQGKVHF